MTRTYILLIVSLFTMFFAGSFFVDRAFAQTPIATANLTVSYTEPSTVVGGAPIKQLQLTTMYFETYDVGGVVLNAWTTNVTATAPTGGGDINWIENHVVNPESKTTTVWATATNPVGESVKTDPVTKTLVIAIPDVGVPNRPFNLTVGVSVTVTVEEGQAGQ